LIFKDIRRVGIAHRERVLVGIAHSEKVLVGNAHPTRTKILQKSNIIPIATIN
jgi:hypothetical protein